MILKLEEKGFTGRRVPGQARSIPLLVDPDEVPPDASTETDWRQTQPADSEMLALR
jgi:hypothetical protein